MKGCVNSTFACSLIAILTIGSKVNVAISRITWIKNKHGKAGIELDDP